MFHYTPLELTLMKVALILFIMVGAATNLGVILAVIGIKKWRSPCNILLANLASADLIVNLWTFPITLASLIQEKQAVSDLFCKVSGFVDNIMILVSVWTLAASSVVRYVMITRPNSQLSKTLNHHSILKITSMIWTSSILVAGLPMAGWDEYIFSPVTYSCSIHGRLPGFHKYYFLFFCIIAFPGPFVLMAFSYSMIFAKMCTVQSTTRKQTIRQVRASVILLVIIVMFSLSTLPTFIIALMFWANPELNISIKIPVVLHWVLISNATLNPVIYSVVNTKYRATWREYITQHRNRIQQRRSIAAPSYGIEMKRRIPLRPLLRQQALQTIPVVHDVRRVTSDVVSATTRTM